MKKIEEMTHEEILNLTDDDLNRMVKLEMAEQGIPILDEPARLVLPDLPGEDITLYTAKVLGEVGFTDREECLEVLDKLKAQASLRRYSNDYSLSCNKVYQGFANDYNDGADAFNLMTVSGRSVTQLQYVKAIIEDRKKIESEYKEEMEAFKKSAKDAQGIRDDIYAVYREHHAMEWRWGT